MQRNDQNNQHPKVVDEQCDVPRHPTTSQTAQSSSCVSQPEMENQANSEFDCSNLNSPNSEKLSSNQECQLSEKPVMLEKMEEDFTLTDQFVQIELFQNFDNIDLDKTLTHLEEQNRRLTKTKQNQNLLMEVQMQLIQNNNAKIEKLRNQFHVGTQTKTLEIISQKVMGATSVMETGVTKINENIDSSKDKPTKSGNSQLITVSPSSQEGNRDHCFVKDAVKLDQNLMEESEEKIEDSANCEAKAEEVDLKNNVDEHQASSLQEDFDTGNKENHEMSEQKVEKEDDNSVIIIQDNEKEEKGLVQETADQIKSSRDSQKFHEDEKSKSSQKNQAKEENNIIDKYENTNDDNQINSSLKDFDTGNKENHKMSEQKKEKEDDNSVIIIQDNEKEEKGLVQETADQIKSSFLKNSESSCSEIYTNEISPVNVSLDETCERDSHTDCESEKCNSVHEEAWNSTKIPFSLVTTHTYKENTSYDFSSVNATKKKNRSKKMRRKVVIENQKLNATLIEKEEKQIKLNLETEQEEQRRQRKMELFQKLFLDFGEIDNNEKFKYSFETFSLYILDRCNKKYNDVLEKKLTIYTTIVTRGWKYAKASFFLSHQRHSYLRMVHILNVVIYGVESKDPKIQKEYKKIELGFDKFIQKNGTPPLDKLIEAQYYAKKIMKVKNIINDENVIELKSLFEIIENTLEQMLGVYKFATILFSIDKNLSQAARDFEAQDFFNNFFA